MIADLEKTTAPVHTGAQIQRINLGDLHPSPTNPRKHFDAESLAELAGSIEEHGVKMPLLARPSKVEAGKFEIVAGERRFRATSMLVTNLPERMSLAAENAELLQRLEALYETRIDLPVVVEDLDDATVLELQLIENLQRKDLTALEEAHGYQRLIELKDKAYTPAMIAQKIGKSINTVLYKLKMLQAPQSLQEALDRGVVGERHLVLVASIPGQKQREECAQRVLKPQWGGVLSVRDTIRVINDEFRQTLKAAPWALDDAEIDKNAGPCSMCPHFAKKAAEQDPELAAELGRERGQTDPLTCMNPACFKIKQAAAWKQREALAKEGQVTVLKPKEAEKIIDEHGHLHHNANYVKLDSKPGYEITGHYDDDKTPTWRELTEGRLPAGAVTVVNTKREGIVEMIDKKLAIATAKEHPKHGKILAKVKESGKKELSAAEKKAKEKQAFDTKVQNATRICLLQHLSERAAEKGMDSDAAKAVLDVALRESGMDGNRLMCDWLKLEPVAKKKGDYNTNQSHYREAILQHVEKTGHGKPEIEALTMIALVAKWVKHYGASFSSMEPLEKHFGFDKKTITALATAQVKAEIEAKAAKKKPVKAGSAANNSVDPKDVSTAKEVSKTAAADKRNKEFVRAVKDYRCDACDCELSVPFGKGNDAARLAKGEMNCVACGGKWQPLDPVESSAEKKTSSEFDAQVTKAKAGVAWTEIIGAMPVDGTKKRKAWDALRVKIWKAAKKSKGAE